MQTQTTFRLIDDGTVARQLAVTRILLERLTDELDGLDRHVWGDDPIDRGRLRDEVDEVTRLAYLALDELTPP